MSVCGVPLIDGRHGRVDFTLTLGEGWETQVCAFDLTGAPIDLTGRTFNAGLMTLDGNEVFDLLPVVSGNCVSLHVAGADTEEEPLGLGVWSWFLREIVPVDEAEYWVGGSFAIHRVNSYSSGGACGPDVVEVCLDSTVNVSVGYRVAGSDVEVVASDAATGRYALQGPNGPVEMGDTGWRDVSTLVEAGWEESRVFIRRTGMVATMQATVKTAGTGTITAYCYALPNGFRTARFAFTEAAGSSRAATMGPARDEGGSGTAYLFAISGNSATSAAATRARITDLAGVNQLGNGRTWSFEATWTVRDADAWPTLLPGTPT